MVYQPAAVASQPRSCPYDTCWNHAEAVRPTCACAADGVTWSGGASAVVRLSAPLTRHDEYGARSGAGVLGRCRRTPQPRAGERGRHTSGVRSAREQTGAT